MGPEGGDGGGTVIAYGTPEEVAKMPNPTPAIILRNIWKKNNRYKKSTILKTVLFIFHDSRMFAERAIYYFGECLPDLRRNQESMSYEKLYFATKQMPDATHRVKMYWLVLF